MPMWGEGLMEAPHRPTASARSSGLIRRTPSFMTRGSKFTPSRPLGVPTLSGKLTGARKVLKLSYFRTPLQFTGEGVARGGERG